MKRMAAAVAVSMALAGCAQAIPGHAPSFFGMTSVDAVAPTIIPARQIVAGPQGSLSLDLSPIVQNLARHVLYSVADIDHVDITITQSSFSSSATIAKASLVAGHATYAFTNLPAGVVSIDIQAKDASGTVIGSDTASLTVVAGQVQNYAPTILLYPTPIQPGLDLDIGFVDGGTQAPITKLGSVPYQSTRAIVDYGMNLVADAYDPNNALDAGGIKRFNPNGTLAAQAAVAAASIRTTPSPIRLDPYGNFWMNRYNQHYVRYDGGLANPVDLGVGGNDINFDPEDNLEVLQNTALEVYTREGARLSSFNLNNLGFPAMGVGQAIYIDGEYTPYVLGFNGALTSGGLWSVTKFSMTGTVLAQYVRPNPLGAANLAAGPWFQQMEEDQQVNHWVLDRRMSRLVKLSKQLTVLADVPVYQGSLAMTCGWNGKVYVYSPDASGPSHLTRYASDGQVEAVASLPPYSPPGQDYHFAADANGIIWLPQASSIDKYSF